MSLCIIKTNLKLIQLFTVFAKREQIVVNLAKLAYTPLYTNVYLLIPMEPQNKTSTDFS